MKDENGKKYEVTCVYCEHFLYNMEVPKVTIFHEGKCIKKNAIFRGNKEICSNFMLRKGTYTRKTYPYKEEVEKERAKNKYIYQEILKNRKF